MLFSGVVNVLFVLSHGSKFNLSCESSKNLKLQYRLRIFKSYSACLPWLSFCNICVNTCLVPKTEISLKCIRVYILIPLWFYSGLNGRFGPATEMSSDLSGHCSSRPHANTCYKKYWTRPSLILSQSHIKWTILSTTMNNWSSKLKRCSILYQFLVTPLVIVSLALIAAAASPDGVHAYVSANDM